MRRITRWGAVLLFGALGVSARVAHAQTSPDTPETFQAAHAAIDSLGRKSTDAALAAARTALAHAQRADAGRWAARFALQVGHLMRDAARYDSAGIYFEEARAAYEARGDADGQVDALLALLASAKDRGAYVEAMTHGLRAARLAEAEERDAAQARSYAELCDVLYYQERHAEGVAYCDRALALYAEGSGDRDGRATAHQYLGENQLILGDYEAALASLGVALELRTALGAGPRALGSLLNSRGNVYKHLARYDEAVADYERALTLIRSLDMAGAVSATEANIADVLIRQERYAQALPYTLRSIEVQESTNFIRNLPENYLHAASIYEGLGRPAEALAYYKKFAATRDSLFNQDKDQVMAGLRAEYEADQREATIALQEERLAQQQTVQRILYGLAALAVLVLVALYFGYRLKQRANARLARANAELEVSLNRLRTTQQRLVHAEKMASLGALTAGIAHEIKNPLNFVTNFSSLSRELVEELGEEADPEERAAILEDLKLNAEKIEEHGRRADGIVRSMMEHARTGKGERQAVDLNALVDEHVNLAYHGRRAQMPNFQVEVERDYDEAVGPVEVVPQDLGRVVLNLVGNAFDAVHEKSAQAGGAYVPMVRVRTERRGDAVVARVEDNGPGMPPAVKAKVFEPFFTTKPAGSGTGLGLSMSYDIVTQGHGGTLTAESAKGEGAAFVITLPEAERVSARSSDPSCVDSSYREPTP